MTSIPQRASRTQEYPDLEEDDSYYSTRLPTSTRRYVDTRGNQVIQQGNKRIVIHEEKPRKKFPWLSLIGIGMIIALLLVWGMSALLTWWTQHQLDGTYGFPRTYQTDQVVGHGDSTTHPTHFIFENLDGHVVIIEIPGGQIQHARIFGGPTLYADNADLIPVTADFKDVNGDGKVDMVVIIQDQRIVFLNDGTKFNPQQ